MIPLNSGPLFPEGLKTIKKAAKAFDVVIIDSWNKLNVHSSEFDKLRKAFPYTIFESFCQQLSLITVSTVVASQTKKLTFPIPKISVKHCA